MEQANEQMEQQRGRAFGLRHLVGVAAVAALIATSATAAFAWTGVFDDIPQSHPFEPEIAWMNYTGISTGYPGTGAIGRDYRPNDPVTRQAMAAFMERLYNLQETTRFASSTNYSITTSASWTDIPGASLTIDVPAGVQSQMHVSFSGESSCNGGAVGAYCSVRIMVDPPAGAAGFFLMGPDAGDVAFDSAVGGTDSWESHSIDRFDDYLGGPGTYTVKAQYFAYDGPSFRLDDWVMVAETDFEANT